VEARNAGRDPESDLEYLGELFGLRGRRALVTGARQGIGCAIALALARAGASVAVTSRRREALDALAVELDALRVVHAELELELTSEHAIRAAVEEATTALGGLDIVVNNAGLSVRKPALELTSGEWDAVMATNLRAPFLLSREAVRAMGDRGGRIVNVSSTFARSAVADRSAYAASKAGLEQLTRALAVEWAPLGVTVNAVALTATPTETRSALLPTAEARARRVRQIPLSRLGEPDDAVGAVLLLLGAAGGFITGHTILVDGGYTLGPGAP